MYLNRLLNKKYLVFIFAILLTACGGGDTGTVGASENTGAKGDAGPAGAVGATGAGSDSVIWLSPGDLGGWSANPLNSKTDVLINGYYQSVIKIKKSTEFISSSNTLIAIPKGWVAATSIKVTVYYAVSIADGNLLFGASARGYSVGDSLSTAGLVTNFIRPAAANTLYASTSEVNDFIKPGSDLVEVYIVRYMVKGGDTRGDDTNTGDLYILAVKIEAALP
jgi:hypothetical protein